MKLDGYPQVSSLHLFHRHISIHKSNSRKQNTNPRAETKRMSNTTMDFLILNKPRSQPLKEISPNCRLQELNTMLHTSSALVTGDVVIKQFQSLDHYKDVLKPPTFQRNSTADKRFWITNSLFEYRSCWGGIPKRVCHLPSIAEIWPQNATICCSADTFIFQHFFVCYCWCVSMRTSILQTIYLLYDGYTKLFRIYIEWNFAEIICKNLLQCF